MKTLFYQLRFALPIWLITLITSLLPDNRVSVKIRGFLVSLFLPNRPKNFTLGRDVTLLGINGLEFGDNVYLAKGCWFNGLGGITIGNDVNFGPYCVVVTTKHLLKNGSVHLGGTEFLPVFVGDGTWIASHVTLTSGISVGCGCVVAANSVVTKDVESESVVGGVPARFIKGI